jgi:hypothetical protein
MWLNGTWTLSNGTWETGPYAVRADGSVAISGVPVGPATALEILEQFHKWYHRSGQAAKDDAAREAFRDLLAAKDDAAREAFRDLLALTFELVGDEEVAFELVEEEEEEDGPLVALLERTVEDEELLEEEEEDPLEAHRYLAWISSYLDLTPGIVPMVDHVVI